jgi:hypothetical protein
MTGRFGWSLQESNADRTASMVIHVLVELGAAALISASSFLLCGHGVATKFVGIIAGVCSMTLICWSMVSVYSFMSVRIARVEAHDKRVAEQKESLVWQRGMSVKRDVPRSERLNLRRERREAEERLEKTLAIIPDAPAQSIADLLSTTVLRVQRALVMIASLVGQIIMQSCLFVGFFVWPRKLPRQASSPPTGGDGGERKPKLVTNNPAKPVPASGVEARTASSPVAMLARSGGEMARTANPTRGPVVSGAHLSDEFSKDLRKAAEWFAEGGSPWRSVRALASDFQVHHRTAGEYVERARAVGRRKASQQRLR